MKKKYKLHLVSHTHWDREWCQTFQQLRIKLVEMIDGLLKLLQENPHYQSFTLDGQTIVLEDYLQIRPEKKEELKKWIKKGKIIVGPWYVQPDEFLVSGESIVRNLIIGYKIAEEFGRVMRIGYLPDSFGHISQLPQILQGFAINSFIFWRGLDENLKTEFIWEAPDGSSVLAIHQRRSYLNLDRLPQEPQKALERIKEEKKTLAPCAWTSNILLNNGGDHAGPQPWVPEIIKFANARLEDAELIQDSFVDYLNQVGKERSGFSSFKGELRSAKYCYLLNGVYSTRMYLKQANQGCQDLLEKWAEPFSTIAWVLGQPYPQSLLNQSYKYLFQNHPHDSISGCSIDEVHQDMGRRFAWSAQISKEIIAEALEAIAREIDTSPGVGSQPIIVFNPLSGPRTDVVEVKVETPGLKPEQLKIKDLSGRIIPCQVIKVTEKATDIREIELLFLAEDVPSFGYKTYLLISSEGRSPQTTSLWIKGTLLENEYYRVEISQNGTLKIIDKETDSVYDGLNLFEDAEDCGDEYDYSPAVQTQVLTSSKIRADFSPIEKGPVRATFRLQLELALPVSLSEDRKKRSKEIVKCPVTSYISLYPRVKRIDLRTVFNNRVKDHRLRALFPTPIKADYSSAEGQFGVSERPIALPEAKDWAQPPYSTHPQQGWVDISDGQRGLTLINKGLPEYEATKNNGTSLCLTLLRCVGWLSREDLLTRRSGAGVPIPTPEAQCQGENIFEYALIPHKGNWLQARTYQEAHRHNNPLKSIATGVHKGELPLEQSFISLEPDVLIITAIKKAEGRGSLIVRFYNIAGEAVEGKITLGKKIKEARLVNLNEEFKEKLRVCSDNSLSLKVKGYEIKTIEFLMSRRWFKVEVPFRIK